MATGPEPQLLLLLRPPSPSSSPPVPLLDIRLDAAVATRHARGSVHIPHTEWEHRRMELPPRGRAYSVLFAGSDGASHAVARDLAARFPRDVVALLDADDDATWDITARPELAGRVGSGAYPPALQPRLWVPGPLASELVRCLAEWLPSASQPPPQAGADLSTAPLPRPPFCVLDAGSGMGRNAIFLAEALPAVLGAAVWRSPDADRDDDGVADAGRRAAGQAAAPPHAPTPPPPRPLYIAAVDNRALMGRRCGMLAHRASLPSHTLVHPVVADVGAYLATAAPYWGPCAADDPADALGGSGPECTARACGWVASHGPIAAFDAVLCARWVDKPVLARIGCAMAAGGALLLVEHFHADCPHPPDPGQKLSEGEVLALVSAGDEAAGSGAVWRTLSERRVAAEDGRPLLQVVLRRDMPQHAL